MASLPGRIAIVTGAATGLGLAIAAELAAEGASVAVLDIDLDTAAAASDQLTGRGLTARPYRADVSKSAQVDAAFRQVVDDFGRLDIVVNNAGLSGVGPSIAQTTDEAWERSIGVMQSGVFFGMRAAARYMLPQRSGAVINISSIRGLSSNPGRVAYCAAKAAVIMMTKVAAGEWAPFGVRANAIAPGVQKTPMWDDDVRRGVIDEPAILAVTPAGRLGDPRDVGRLAVYLAGDDSAYVNGACVTIDGALSTVPIEGTITRPAETSS